MVVNHVGLRVADVDRSVAFYRAFGFDVVRDMEVPDEASSRLMQLDPPVGLRAVYLVNEGFVLELLAFDPDHHPAVRDGRTLTNAGLTHLSIGVDDMDAAKARVAALGGEVIAESDVDVAVMVRDPDGQLLELLRRDRAPVPHD